ncbi:MAG: Copper binding protein plastocyanin/azurin family [Solirubrobacteraceae bacterium]|jgi:plastocyanin|nr:Copper binding protein plastocyanin/azurin family [Solirubrobacteraceae bacterium]
MRIAGEHHQAGRAVAAVATALVLLGAAPAGSHPGHGPPVISISEFKYAPSTVNVVEGDYVFWSWDGPDTNHTVTADAGQTLTFDSDKGRTGDDVTASPHKTGDGFSVFFKKAGTYAFHCKVHSFMHGQVVVAKLPDNLKPKPLTKPRLTKVSARPVKLCKQRHCAHTGVLVRYTINEAVSMRATVRRRKGSRAVGAVIREVDFNGPPGANRRRLDLGRLRAGHYQLALVAVDASSGAATKPARVSVVVR